MSIDITVLGKQVKPVKSRLLYKDALVSMTWFVHAVCADNTYILKTRSRNITLHNVTREDFTVM